MRGKGAFSPSNILFFLPPNSIGSRPEPNPVRLLANARNAVSTFLSRPGPVRPYLTRSGLACRVAALGESKAAKSHQPYRVFCCGSACSHTSTRVCARKRDLVRWQWPVFPCKVRKRELELFRARKGDHTLDPGAGSRCLSCLVPSAMLLDSQSYRRPGSALSCVSELTSTPRRNRGGQT